MPVVLLLLGVAFVVDAVARGAASVALFVVFPVVSGTSAEFLLGVVLLLAGFLTVPLAFAAFEDPSATLTPVDPRARGEAPTGELGGLLLVGPIPIFFGSWKGVPVRTKVAVVVVGAVVFFGVVWAILFH